MFCGSVASGFHGVPRNTRDVDLVVVLPGMDIPALLAALPDDEYYVSEPAVQHAVRRQGQFNVIDMATGWKADLIVRKRRAFSREEFSRRVEAEVLGVTVWVASPEDTILAKLEWGKASAGSERQLRDAAGIVSVGRDSLDWDYLTHWANELGAGGMARNFAKREARGGRPRSFTPKLRVWRSTGLKPYSRLRRTRASSHSAIHPPATPVEQPQSSSSTSGMGPPESLSLAQGSTTPSAQSWSASARSCRVST